MITQVMEGTVCLIMYNVHVPVQSWYCPEWRACVGSWHLGCGRPVSFYYYLMNYFVLLLILLLEIHLLSKCPPQYLYPHIYLIELRYIAQCAQTGLQRIWKSAFGQGPKSDVLAQSDQFHGGVSINESPALYSLYWPFTLVSSLCHYYICY